MYVRNGWALILLLSVNFVFSEIVIDTRHSALHILVDSISLIMRSVRWLLVYNPIERYLNTLGHGHFDREHKESYPYAVGKDVFLYDLNCRLGFKHMKGRRGTGIYRSLHISGAIQTIEWPYFKAFMWFSQLRIRESISQNTYILRGILSDRSNMKTPKIG